MRKETQARLSSSLAAKRLPNVERERDWRKYCG